MASLMASMQSPDAASSIESRLASLKEDPELAPVLKEIEAGGPTAMMKYWNDPAVLEKLSKAMGGAFGGAAAAAGALGAGAAAADGEGDGEGAAAAGDCDGDAPATVLEAATKGDSAALQKLIDGGADCNEADKEDRSALHFASGYGELDCVRVLVKAGVKIDAGTFVFLFLCSSKLFSSLLFSFLLSFFFAHPLFLSSLFLSSSLPPIPLLRRRQRQHRPPLRRGLQPARVRDGAARGRGRPY